MADKLLQMETKPADRSMTIRYALQSKRASLAMAIIAGSLFLFNLLPATQQQVFNNAWKSFSPIVGGGSGLVILLASLLTRNRSEGVISERISKPDITKSRDFPGLPSARSVGPLVATKNEHEAETIQALYRECQELGEQRTFEMLRRARNPEDTGLERSVNNALKLLPEGWTLAPAVHLVEDGDELDEPLTVSTAEPPPAEDEIAIEDEDEPDALPAEYAGLVWGGENDGVA